MNRTSKGAMALALTLAACGRPEVTERRSSAAVVVGEGPTSPTGIRGYLAVRVPQGQSARDIHLPGIRASLRDPSTGVTLAAVTTDLSGRFNFPPQQKGRYQLCWASKNLLADCAPALVTVSNGLVHVGTIRIPLPKSDRLGVPVFGEVRLADGGWPRRLDPLVNANAFAKVTLFSGAGATLDKVMVNNFGEYFIPRVPTGAEVKLRTTLEAAVAEQTILPGANLFGAPVHRIDVRLPNRGPRLGELTARDGSGRRVRVGQPGLLVKLSAEVTDDDGDPPQLRWSLGEGGGTLSDTTSQDVDWTLPSGPGTFAVTVVAYDGKGGYARSTLSLESHDKGILFAGTVRATDAPAVDGAIVSVNGEQAKTDPAGHFSLRVKDADRYVFGIHRRGYAAYGKVYDDGVAGGVWTLTRASVRLVDPNLPIDVTNERRPGDCPGSFVSRFDWRKNPAVAEPQWQDGKGHVIPPPAKNDAVVPLVPSPKLGLFGRGLGVLAPGTPNDPPTFPPPQKDCGPGARVQIPAGALVDANGNPPPGLVEVEMATVDLGSPEQMPGDETVAMSDGSSKVMQSWGAGIFEFWSAGVRYNLRPGTEALVTIPADPTQLAAGGPLPSELPLLYYDEARGLWYDDGKMTLVGTSYQAKVKHFSTINADDTKTNQACLDVHSAALPSSYEMEVTIPQAIGQAPKFRSYHIDNASPSRHVIINLPTNTKVTLVPYDAVTLQPFGVFVVDTGGPQNPTSPNLPVNYDSCATDVTLAPTVLPQDPTGGEFLHGLLSFQATNLSELNPAVPAENALKTALEQASTDYFAQVDPRSKRLTFTDFRNANGFPGGETRAVYANGGDLGFGRDMHCRKTGSDVACYVTNYGDHTTDDSADAQAALDGLAPVATVAMEYARIENPPGDPTEYTDPERVVKFFVYNAAGTRVGAANLDGKGLRPVPQLCMVCHGGEYPIPPIGSIPSFATADDTKLGSVFLPFDLAYYKFPATPGWDKGSQQVAFRTLNEDMVVGSNTTPQIADVVTHMYSGGLPQNESLVVAGWNADAGKQAMYRNVVGHTCRTCHAANPASSLRFSDANQMMTRLGAVETLVCQQHVMPHSLITHNLFWQSIAPNMAAQLESFGEAHKAVVPGNGWVGNKCGVFTPGSGTPPPPPTFYNTTIQGIFDARCTGCHIGGSPPAGLNLSAATSHAAIVNVSSTELGSMKRIKPNDVPQSYLLHKVKGTQGSVGGSGSQMPLGGSPLSGGQIGDLDTWVNTGALP